jgi:glycosyltransferase involved in cell wall biosynthesis
MRIGFDAKRAFSNHTGLGNYSRFVIEALCENRSLWGSLDYLFYTTKVPKPQDLVWLNKFSQNYAIRTPPLGEAIGALWRSWLINNDLKKDNVDIFHGLSNEIPFGIRKSGIKSVVTVHDLIFLRYPELYPTIDRFFYQQKFRYACENADAVVAVSQQTKDDIIEFYKIPAERIRVIYQDCQSIFYQEPPLSIEQQTIMDISVKLKYSLSQPYIICVSSFSERKNQKRLVEAFLRLGLKDYTLVLVGKKSKYAEEIAQNYSKNIKILYGVSSADLPALYRGSSLSVYPSFFEGFGIPIIEALHSGVPVVAATGSCLEEAGGEGALYANPLEINDLANKIQQVLSNDLLRNNLILKGKEHIKQFSAPRISDQLIKLYQEL